MSTLKLLRELKKELAKDGITFTVDTGQKAHPKLTVTYPDKSVRHFNAPSSPVEQTEAIRYMVKLIKQPMRTHA